MKRNLKKINLQILAKLACGLHKPNRQTILPASSVPELFGALPVKKVRHLGGKLGDIVIDMLKCNVMADLLPFSLQQLQNRFDEKTGYTKNKFLLKIQYRNEIYCKFFFPCSNWLYNIARGIDNEPVTPRLVSKSIGACKRFPGKQVIVSIDVVSFLLEKKTKNKSLNKIFLIQSDFLTVETLAWRIISRNMRKIGTRSRRKRAKSFVVDSKLSLLQ